MQHSVPIDQRVTIERHTALDRAAIALLGGGEHAIEASPFVLRDPKLIPPRPWLYGGHLIRKFVSATLAPGGVGKSSLIIGEALAMVTGRPLLGVTPDVRCCVWLWNGEDPLEEIERRIAAACLHHKIGQAEIDGRLFVNSGRDTEIILARQTRDGITVAEPAVEQIIQTIEEHGIDVVVIDPFVSSHQVTENDNNAVDRVVKTWAKIADRTGCAIDLVHHTRKAQQPGADITMEDGRGAVALTAAMRSVRTLNPMSEKFAKMIGVRDRSRYFHVDYRKSSMKMAASDDKTDWYRHTPVDLGNGSPAKAGDSVGVVTAWAAPDVHAKVSDDMLDAAVGALKDGRWRWDRQAAEWAGKPIAGALEIDLDQWSGKGQVQKVLDTLVRNRRAAIVDGKDAKGTIRKFIEVMEVPA